MKVGDYLLFSGGLEEAKLLARLGIVFEFVPGVTFDLAAGATASIPAAHRDLSSSFCVVTGNGDASGRFFHLDWGRSPAWIRSPSL